MADMQSQSDAFLDWFRSQPGATFHPSLAITDLRSRNAGRGIIATAPIPADTELFSIPRSSIISVANSTLSKELPHIFTTLRYVNDEMVEMKLPDPWLDLILVLIYEYLQGPSSNWAPYFSVLPSSFNTPMFWTPSEIDELQASAVKDKIGKASADEMFATKILPTVKGHSEIFYPSNTPVLNDTDLTILAHRMGSIIMAYAFDLEPSSPPVKIEQDTSSNAGWEEDLDDAMSMGMVPMADLLNADAEFNAHLNHGDESLSMISLRPIQAGEEVLNYYGPLPTSDLLRRYGYTSAKHARYDVVELDWEVVLQCVRNKYSGKPLGDLDEEDMEDSFVIERDSGEPDETGRVTSPALFTGFPDELQAQVYQTIAPVLGVDVSKKPAKEDRKRLERAFYEIVGDALRVMAGKYATGIEHDEQLLGRQDVQGRLRMAVEVRLGEKRLLVEALEYAQDQVKSLTVVEEEKQTDGGRPAKKQRMR